MKKVTTLLLMFCACLAAGAFSACKNKGQESISTSMNMEESMGSQYEDSSMGNLHVHQWDDGVVISEPTCSVDGLRKFTCEKGCGETKTEAIPEVSHDYGKGVITTEPTCEAKGVKTFACVYGCGLKYTRKIDALGHAYNNGVVTQEATCEQKGVMTYTCANGCGGYTEEIPMIDHEYEKVNCIMCGTLRISKGLSFALNDDGVSYTVTGMGWCDDEDLVIPSTYNDLPVTRIGVEAFSFTSLVSVIIPDSVISIGERAFHNWNLSIESPTSVVIGDSVTEIGDEAFRECDNLSNLVMGKSVQTIGDYAFYGCSELTSLTLPNSLISIGERAFVSGGFSTLVIPDSVTSIGKRAFSSSVPLMKLDLGASVTHIGEAAFMGCDKLIEVYNKSSLEITPGSNEYGYIGYYAKNVYTPTMGEGKLFTSADGYILYPDSEGLILMGYVGDETDLILPAGIVAISPYVFCDASVTSVVIPNSVTSIQPYTFYRCTSLECVEIPNSVTSIGEDSFGVCKALLSVEIPGSVKIIDDYAFHDCGGILFKDVWIIMLNSRVMG